MESLSPDKENTIKDIRNLFRLRQEQNYAAIKYIRNLFRLEKEAKVIKIEHLGILRIFLSMKKKKIIVNQ